MKGIRFIKACYMQRYTWASGGECEVVKSSEWGGYSLEET